MPSGRQQPVEIEDGRLIDGSCIGIRQVRPDDKGAITRGFERLSPRSRYRRFLTPVNRLSQAQLRYLTEVDHTDHEALVAIPGDGDPVGIARYVRGDDPDVAEFAVAVIDDWQGRGVGTALLHALVDRALTAGVKRFSAYLLSENRAIIELLEALGPEVSRSHVEPGVLKLEIQLPGSSTERSALNVALRHSAKGDLKPRHRLPPA